MKKCLIISKLHRQPAAVSYFWFWFIPDSHHQHQAASAPHRSCRLLPPPGDQQWAGSRLSGCDITFTNIYRWKFVHIWKRAPLSPPVGAIPCRHLSCSLCSLGMCVCDCEYVCVCVCVTGRGRGEGVTLPYKADRPGLSFTCLQEELRRDSPLFSQWMQVHSRLHSAGYSGLPDNGARSPDPLCCLSESTVKNTPLQEQVLHAKPVNTGKRQCWHTKLNPSFHHHMGD